MKLNAPNLNNLRTCCEDMLLELATAGKVHPQTPDERAGLDIFITILAKKWLIVRDGREFDAGNLARNVHPTTRINRTLLALAAYVELLSQENRKLRPRADQFEILEKYSPPGKLDELYTEALRIRLKPEIKRWTANRPKPAQVAPDEKRPSDALRKKQRKNDQRKVTPGGKLIEKDFGVFLHPQAADDPFAILMKQTCLDGILVGSQVESRGRGRFATEAIRDRATPFRPLAATKNGERSFLRIRNRLQDHGRLTPRASLR